MKFCLNGGLLVGTVGELLVAQSLFPVIDRSEDGANIEIAEEVSICL